MSTDLLSIPRLGQVPPGLDLVAFPCAGSGAASFRGWRPLLPPDWRFTIVGLPGREASYGQPFATDMSRLADDIAAALRARRPAEQVVPLVLFGHSMGGLLALLVAQRLPADALVVAACPPPAELWRTQSDDPLDAATLRAEVTGLLGATVVDGGLLDELVALTLPILVADIALLETFQPPDAPIDCGIWALYGEEDLVKPTPWSAETTGLAGCSMVPGSHFFVQESPSQVTSQLRRCVSELIGGRL